MNKQTTYTDKIPPCGIFCGACPNFTRHKNNCRGVSDGCKKRKCKSIYVCCVENKGLNFCYECSIFPCSRFKKFASTWKKYGQDLIKNQNLLKQKGEKLLIYHYNNLTPKY